MQPRQPTTLLLVEDEAIVSLAQRRTLERNGYLVAVAHSGETAVAHVRDHPDVDLILMDIDLGPGIDGTEASRRILALRDVPIVFLTSHTEPEYVDRVKEITGYGYVVKSSGEFVLLESIEMALKLWRAHRRSREEEERYRSIVENTNDALIVHDFQAVVTFVNAATVRLLGYTEEELVGMSLAHLHAPSSREGFRSFADAGRWNDQTVVEEELVARDGRRIPVEVSAVIASRGGAGEVYAFLRDLRGRRESEKAFRAVYDQTGESISVFDEDCRFLQANRAAAAKLGLQPAELRGLTLGDVYPPQYAARAVETIRKVFETGRSRYGEWKTAIGEQTRWFLVHVEPNVEPEGVVSSVTTFSIDITELKRAQESYRLIAEHASDVVGVLDEELRPAYISPSVQRLFGYSVDDFDDRSVLDAVHEDDVTRLRALFRAAIRDHAEAVRHEFRIVTPEGEVKWTELVATNLYDEHGDLDRIIMTARDITSRAQLDARLRETTSRLSAVLNAIPELVFELDGRLQFTEYQAPDHKHLYLPPERFLGRPIEDVLPPQAAERVREAVAQLSDTRPAVRVDYALAGDDGQRFFRASIARHGADGPDPRESLRYVAVVHDVTDLLRAQQELHAALEHNRWLIREVHHRVKNNLSIVSSLISLTEDGLPEGVDLSNLRNQIEAVRLVHEQLQSVGDEQAVDMAPYLYGLLSTVFTSSSAVDVELRVEADGIALPGRHAVSVGLIANELATNARKHGFTEDGERSFTISLTREAERYVLTGTNSGRPFPDEIDPYASTSLGLQLVVNLAEQLGGELVLVRRPHPVFTIRFPAPA